METFTISKISEFIDLIKEIRQTWFKGNNEVHTIWYRGINDNSLKLLPGAHWRNKCDEESLVNTFTTMLPSYTNSLPTSDWDWYFSMQHYGLPTRLLDWTENPLYALYFALSTKKSKKTPCVYVLDPVALNKASYGPSENWIFVPGGESINNFLPDFCGRNKQIIKCDDPEKLPSNEFPIAIFPNRSNPRLVAQRGVFTLHGINEIPIDKHLENNKFKILPRIININMDVKKSKELFTDLYYLGIDVFQLFPEPDKISQYAKEIYGIK